MQIWEVGPPKVDDKQMDLNKKQWIVCLPLGYNENIIKGIYYFIRTINGPPSLCAARLIKLFSIQWSLYSVPTSLPAYIIFCAH
jgi:hypothetical protein